MKSTGSESVPAIPGGSEPEMARLAGLIRAYAPHDGQFELRISGVHVSRASRTNTELVYATARPSLCIIAQGAKSVLLGQEVYEYDASRMLVFSVDLPVAGQVTRASHSEPYLGFRLDLDPPKIAELVLKVYPRGVPHTQASRGVYLCSHCQFAHRKNCRLGPRAYFELRGSNVAVDRQVTCQGASSHCDLLAWHSHEHRWMDRGRHSVLGKIHEEALRE